jgi:uncharacterized OB-fold protein
MTKLPLKQEESLGGTIVHNLPFPRETTPEALQWLKEMAPILIEMPYNVVYLHSYAQDSPWFAGLTNKRILANQDPESGYTYATPRGHDMYSGSETKWIDITENQASIHAFTVCHFGSEAFLDQTPFVLVLVEFEGVNTLLLSRLLGVDPMKASLDWMGMKLKPQFIRNSKLKPTDVYFVPA